MPADTDRAPKDAMGGKPKHTVTLAIETSCGTVFAMNWCCVSSAHIVMCAACNLHACLHVVLWVTGTISPKQLVSASKWLLGL